MGPRQLHLLCFRFQCSRLVRNVHIDLAWAHELLDCNSGAVSKCASDYFVFSKLGFELSYRADDCSKIIHRVLLQMGDSELTTTQEKEDRSHQ